MGASICLHNPEVTEVVQRTRDDGENYWVIKMRVGELDVWIFVDDLENFIEPMQCEL